VHGWTLPFQIAAMVALAAASTHWIESPIRRGTWGGPQAPVALALIPVALLSTYGVQQLGAKVPWLGRIRVPDLPDCQGSPASPTWIVGDSHAGALQKTIAQVTGGQCFVVVMNELASEPSLNLQMWHRVYRKQGQASLPILGSSELVRRVRQAKPRQLVLALYWQGYFNPQPLPSSDGVVTAYGLRRGGQVKPISGAQALAAFSEGVADLARRLEPTTRVVVVAPQVEFNWINMGGIGDRQKVDLACQGSWYTLRRPMQPYADLCRRYQQGATVPRQQVEERRREILQALGRAGVPRLVDTVPVLCQPRSCSTHSPEGVLLYRDDDHTNSNAAERLTPLFAAVLQPGGEATRSRPQEPEEL
jgi:hypothetical protein